MSDELFERVLIQLEPKLAQEFRYAMFRNCKKLKTLEIINEKNVNLALIKISKSVEEYNKWALVNNLLVDIDQRTLTKQEFDLLKEVLLHYEKEN